MKQKRNILVPLFVVPAFLAMASEKEQPEYHPSEGSVLSKRIENKSEVSLDDMTMVMNGQEMDQAMMGMEMTTTSVLVVSITDRYEAVAEGRPAKLVRTFDELSSVTEVATSNAMMGESDVEMNGGSELEGLTVIYSWNDDDGEYTLAFDEDSDGDEELLEGLTEDTDLRDMLPEGAVSEGDSWDVEPEALRGLFAPCGAVKIEPENLEELMGGMNAPQPSPAEFLGEFEGSVTAEFTEVAEEDGVRVAVIELEIDVSTAKDLTEFMEEMMSGMEMPDGMEMEMDVESFDMEYAFESSGRLLWNLEAGVLHSLEVEGDVSQALDTAMSIAMGEMEQSIEQSLALSGSATITFQTE